MNCSVVNQTTESLEVECLPGFDGGLRQFFLLEITDLQTGILLANATDTQPEFQVSTRYSLCQVSVWQLPVSSLKLLKTCCEGKWAV